MGIPATMEIPSVDIAATLEDDVFQQIKREPIYCDFKKAFEEATGLSLGLRAVGSNQLPCHGFNSPLTELMGPCGRSQLLRMQQCLETKARQGTSSAECIAGVHYSLIPVRVGLRIIAFLQCGHVRLQSPTETAFRGLLRLLGSFGEAIEPGRSRKAFFAFLVVSPTRYAGAVRLLEIFADQLATRSNSILLQKNPHEHPTVMRARLYIQTNYADDINLGAIAAHVHVSQYYFCKVFRDGTGMTFGTYLAHFRVEAVKRILLDRHKRMSEAAFEAGFQSLSQFNRVFMAVSGETPTSYSRNLHTPPVSQPTPTLAIAV